MTSQRRKSTNRTRSSSAPGLVILNAGELRREMTDVARADHLLSPVAGDASFNSLAALFRFLDPPNRQLLRLLRRLGPVQISTLVTESGRPLSEIEMVLAVLRAIGLVRMDKAAGRRLWTALPVSIHITIDPYKRDRWIKIRVSERIGRFP
ncbi:protein of unknown function [Hyphomicrobium sp. 1Nfss2.1]|uniref:HVO_A0114 family putative DNA-binding protein n=1 Tax=Hyphomicrobium sp. 1Nfss2.1 TaxID=3413936 RepID=UPI003C79F297